MGHPRGYLIFTTCSLNSARLGPTVLSVLHSIQCVLFKAFLLGVLKVQLQQLLASAPYVPQPYVTILASLKNQRSYILVRCKTSQAILLIKRDDLLPQNKDNAVCLQNEY